MRLSNLGGILFAMAGALTIFLLAACEKSYGVKRSAQLSQLPDPACVRAAIENVPEIRDYDEWHWPEGGEGVPRAEEVRYAHHFAYDGDQARVQFGMFDDGGDRIRLVQSFVKINERPPQGAVDEARYLMIALEHELTRRCGMEELGESVHESCSGVECN